MLVAPNINEQLRKKVRLNEDEIKYLQELLSSIENTSIMYQEELSGIWFWSKEYETELRIGFWGKMKLIISRVEFHNRRKGNMTKVFNYLKDFCIKNQIGQIVVQCVLTKEMAMWCEKNNFVSSQSSAYYDDGFIKGDYVYQVTSLI